MTRFGGASSIRRGRTLLGRSAVVALALAALTVTGCATGTGGGRRVGTQAGADRDADIARLKDRVLELQRRLSVTEVEIDRLRREVARLSGNPIEEGARATGTGDRTASTAGRRQPTASTASTGARSNRPAVGSPSASERGFEVEEIDEPSPGPPDAPPAAVEERPGAERPGSDATAGGAGDRVRVEPPAAADDTAPSATGSAAPADELTEEAQALYDRGYALYHQGRFVDAESTFQQFLQAHGGTELADNAQYWIGEARLARGDTKGALSAFREVARRFPDGNKVPDALLKAAETQASAGDAAGARETYREVIRKFPGTTAAAVARDRLSALG